MTIGHLKRDLNPRWILWPLAVVFAVLLFVGGPGHHPPRSLAAFWDLGHVAAFSLWSFLLLRWKPVEEASIVRQWGIVLGFSLMAGVATEGIQSWIGGDASLGDVLRDIAGGVIALSWLAASANALPKNLRRMVRGLGAAVLVIACFPLFSAVSDEMVARLQFPVLADFGSPFEAGRWTSGTLDRSVSRSGKASLRVEMDTSLYSGVALEYFPGDWRRFRALEIEILNPSPESLDITCRIHDSQHEKGEQRHSDRFNKMYRLQPGWNNLRIDLEEVARTPSGRTMDLGEIRFVGLFATRLSVPRTIFIDYVRLV